MKPISEGVFFDVLSALFEEWLKTETIAQIREDEDKVQLMLKVRDAITEPPRHIAEFYSGVFLRDHWDSHSSGATPGSFE
ncbi:hypothetical protein [Sphingopyxis flava]|uniref:Uncharacterized protein n=1 Tax=Sphingopyxis flava TaxID=1507287 RepID=A0A1T5CU89_9SPHN|nr:hypothetical protein [Sphingopyxis flava]SKB63108.1 hypothetical protein SAMN06295937_1011132 [Sphingopyxis flava]